MPPRLTLSIDAIVLKKLSFRRCSAQSQASCRERDRDWLLNLWCLSCFSWFQEVEFLRSVWWM
jgi:hypothetical protein